MWLYNPISESQKQLYMFLYQCLLRWLMSLSQRLGIATLTEILLHLEDFKSLLKLFHTEYNTWVTS